MATKLFYDYLTTNDEDEADFLEAVLENIREGWPSNEPLTDEVVFLYIRATWGYVLQ